MKAVTSHKTVLNQRQCQQPLRGVIVVDSSVIFPLGVPTPDHFLRLGAREREEHEKRGLRILKFLADKGYRVLIPEMVAFETAGALYRPPGVKGKAGKLRLMSEILKSESPREGERGLAFFYRQCAAGALGPNIEIVPPRPDDNSLSARVMRDLTDIADADRSPRWKSREYGDLKHRVRDELGGARQSPLHLGDEAAHRLLQKLDVPEGVPVFYLSNDRDALRNLNEPPVDRQVNGLNLFGLLRAFEKNNYFRDLQFADNITTPDLCRQMETDFKRSSQKSGAHVTTFIDDAPDMLQRLGEWGEMDGWKTKPEDWSYPFHESLQQVRSHERVQRFTEKCARATTGPWVERNARVGAEFSR